MSSIVGLGMAARLIGRCTRTLVRWDQEGVFLARKDKRGRRVYSGTDIAEMQLLAASRKAGRKRKPDGA